MLVEDQNVSAIRKNVIALLYRLAKLPPALALLRSHFKDRNWNLDESLCTEEELEEYSAIKDAFK
jgi:hypothetical protein